MKTPESLNEKLSSWLWIILLIVLGVASTCSIRWISPFLHMSSTFGPGRDQTYALILGFVILAVIFFTFLIDRKKDTPIGSNSVDHKRNYNTNKQAQIGGVSEKRNYNINQITQTWNFLLKSSTIVLFSGLIISTIFASDKPAAIFTAGGLAVGMGLMAAVYKLADRRWKVQLALIVLTSLGATFAARTWIRELYEFDHTWQNYVETRDEFWAKQGKALDDPTVKMFEARLKSRDNGGFFFHGNLGGMYLATVFIISLALVGQRWAQRRQRYGGPWLAIAVLLSLFILSALILTWSKGAIASAGIGLLIISVIWRWGDVMRQHFRWSVLITLLLMVAGIGAVVGWGVTKKTLPSLSMAYRWQYWVASYEMFKDRPITGVGSGNFGTYYLKYKLPEAEEEVTSPHNFIVQGFSQFGLIGGIGFLLLPMGIFYQAASRSRREEERLVQESSPSAVGVWVALSVGIFGTLFVFNQTGYRQVMGLVAEYLPYFLIFSATFVMCSLKGDRLERIESEEVTGWTRLCLAVAGVVFILGDLVNFSLEEPSMQFLFFVLAGLMMARGNEEESGCGLQGTGGGKKRKHLAVWAVLAVWAGYVYFMMIPGISAEGAAVRGEKGVMSSNPNADEVYREFVSLARRYPYDGYLAAAVGDRLVRMAGGSSEPEWLIREAVDWYHLASRRIETQGMFYSKQGQAYLILAKLVEDKRDHYLSKAEEAFVGARIRSPMSKGLALTLGMVYADHIRQVPAGQSEKIAALAERSRENLDDAMRLDSALPHESIRRFSDSQYETIDGIRRYLGEGRE